ncbi:hypothetical protein ACVWXL_001184 [Bradyrhizobium sp. GM22.5]
MPVSSENALASVCDSYSWVVMVSETTLISIPLKGSAALANHSSSFFWSSFDSVEGWNSAIHFWIAASSAARTGAETASDNRDDGGDAGHRQKAILGQWTFPSPKLPHVIPPLQRQTFYRPGLVPDLAVPSRARPCGK